MFYKSGNSISISIGIKETQNYGPGAAPARVSPPSTGGPPLASVSGNPEFGPQQQYKEFPAFETLKANYPELVNGNPAHPSVDKYKNQCAIRMSVTYQASKMDMTSYPRERMTTDGYARSSRGLANWTRKNYGAPEVMSGSTWESEYANNPQTQGVLYMEFGPNEGHIDLYYPVLSYCNPPEKSDDKKLKHGQIF